MLVIPRLGHTYLRCHALQHDATSNRNVTAYNPPSKSLLACHLPFAKPRPHVSQCLSARSSSLGLAGIARQHRSSWHDATNSACCSATQAARRWPCHLHDPFSETDDTSDELNGTAPRHSVYPGHPTKHTLAHRLTYTHQIRGQKNKECQYLGLTQRYYAHTILDTTWCRECLCFSLVRAFYFAVPVLLSSACHLHAHFFTLWRIPQPIPCLRRTSK